VFICGVSNRMGASCAESLQRHWLCSLGVFENRVLRREFGPNRDEVTGELRKLHNKELNDLYCSPNIVRVIKSRRMRWSGHVSRIGERRGIYRVMVRNPDGKNHLEDKVVDGRIVLRWMRGHGLDRAGSG